MRDRSAKSNKQTQRDALPPFDQWPFLFSRRQLAAWLNVSPNTVRRAVDSGKLKPTQPHDGSRLIYTRESVREWLSPGTEERHAARNQEEGAAN